jgi:nicotinamide-nucleotide amidase
MNAPTDAEIRAVVERLAGRLGARGLRLAVAESCTGGWLAKACTDVPGSSAWFLGGVVAYDNSLKRELLGVGAAILDGEGAVSESTVRAMAEGIATRTGADLAVAVSGVAGPDGGLPGKPVGTVWLAWSRRDERAVHTRVELRHFEGDREAVRRQAVSTALGGVRIE